MNLDSNLVQRTIKSLLTDVTPKVLTTIPDISEFVSSINHEDNVTKVKKDAKELHSKNPHSKNPHSKNQHNKKISSSHNSDNNNDHHAISLLYVSSSKKVSSMLIHKFLVPNHFLIHILQKK